MKYNIHSFRFTSQDYEGAYSQDVTNTAHAFLEKEYNILIPTFNNIDDANAYARKAALYIMRRRGCNEVTYCISGYEDNAPRLDVCLADFFETTKCTLKFEKE